MFGTGPDATYEDYLRGGFPWFATPDGYMHVWIEDKSLYLQWAPVQ